ncbi:hypothetical protein ACC743_39150, partial [Rhizobium ruizarguesonis]
MGHRGVLSHVADAALLGVVGGSTGNTHIPPDRGEIGVNLTGSFLGMQAVLPAMRKARSGSIVN